jgi:putative transposase
LQSNILLREADSLARPLRIEFPGALYHVTSRGDGREAIFIDDGDRQTFLDILATTLRRMRVLCHAYCLMDNHYHLLLETPEGNLARALRQLNGVYTQAFNRRHRRVGHVFQGRYKAILVQRDTYLLALARYVVLNPVRAKQVSDPAAWPWSSHRSLAGLEPAPPWLHTASILAHFPHRRAYTRFVRAGLAASSVWGGLRQQIFLGDDEFVGRMHAQGASRAGSAEIPRAQRRLPPKPLSYYAGRFADPHRAMVAAFQSGAYTMQAIAAHFGVHYATVSRAVRRAEKARQANV